MQVIRSNVTALPVKPRAEKQKRVRALDAPIERGIPFPGNRSRNSPWKRKLYGMEVGDSFLVETFSEAQTCRTAVCHLVKSHPMFKGRKYTVAQMDLTTVWRCWRLK